MSFFVSCPITNAQADPHLLRAWSKKRHTCMLPDFMQALLCLIARQIPQLLETLPAANNLGHWTLKNHLLKCGAGHFKNRHGVCGRMQCFVKSFYNQFVIYEKMSFGQFADIAISAKCLKIKIIAFIKPLIICYLPILLILAFLVNSYCHFCYLSNKSYIIFAFNGTNQPRR